jgi:FecR protein
MKNLFCRLRLVAGLGLITLLASTSMHNSQAQQQINVRVDRWLALEQIVGKVFLSAHRQQPQPAQKGNRLQNVGDTLTTQARSSARLALDTNIGTVDVAADTQVVIQGLSINPDQSRITRLTVPRGRVMLRLRKFTNPNSRFEIDTPAGISGVRGTEFGVVVQPSGKMTVAVLEGAVNTNAQSVDVSVPQGFQNFTIPGEPPSAPVPLRDDASLQYRFERRIESNQRRLRLVGQVDPVNSVLINGKPQDTDREGRFRVDIPLVSFPRVQILVSTPLGQEKIYDLAF